MRRRGSRAARNRRTSRGRCASSSSVLAREKSNRSFVVPGGVSAGQRFIVKGKNGQSVAFVLPRNTTPGQKFEVTIPLREIGEAAPAAQDTERNVRTLNGTKGPKENGTITRKRTTKTSEQTEIDELRQKVEQMENILKRLGMEDAIPENGTDERVDPVLLSSSNTTERRASVNVEEKHAEELHALNRELLLPTTSARRRDDIRGRMNGLILSAIDEELERSDLTEKERSDLMNRRSAVKERSEWKRGGQYGRPVHSTDGAASAQYKDREIYVIYQPKDKEGKDARSNLMDIFSKFGVVTNIFLPKSLRKGGKLPSYVAFVSMSDKKMCDAAVEAFNNDPSAVGLKCTNSSSPIKVVRPVLSDVGTTLFVNHLPDVEDSFLRTEIESMLIPYGDIVDVRVNTSGRSNRKGRRKFAFVTMRHKNEAIAAMHELHNKRTIVVNSDKQGERRVSTNTPLWLSINETSDGQARTHQEVVDAIVSSRDHEVSHHMSKSEFLKTISNKPLSAMSKKGQKRMRVMLTGFAPAITRKEFDHILEILAGDGQFVLGLDFCRAVSKEGLDEFKNSPETFGRLIVANTKSRNCYDNDVIMNILRVCRQKQIKPPIRTLNAALQKCRDRSNTRGMEKIVEQMRSMSIPPSFETFRCIVGTYANQYMSDHVDSAIEEMERMGIDSRPEIYTHAIRACERDTVKASSYISHMDQSGMSANKFHFTELAQVYMRAGKVDDIKNIVDRMRRRDVEIDDVFVSHWGTAYCRDGDWRKCVDIFSTHFVDFNTRISWKMNHVLTSLKKHRRWAEITEFFEAVESGDRSVPFTPDMIIGSHLTHVVHAYGQLGNWDRVLECNDRLQDLAIGMKPSSRAAVQRQVLPSVKAAHRAKEEAAKAGSDSIRIEIVT